MAKNSKTSKKLSKKLDKLEKRGDQLRAKAERKGKELTSMASDRIDDMRPEPEEEKGGKGKFLLLLLGAIGAFVTMKRKRDQELDEALWEEPRSI